jgi:pSer/pThr/pTyr-binding forkhead associated (FHA) protein
MATAVLAKLWYVSGMAYLEHYPKQGGTPLRVPLSTLPFRLGRSSTCHFVVLSKEVSKEHAEIFRVGNEYRVRDLRSTNGTFVNGARITEAPLASNACIKLGEEAFWFRTDSDEATSEWGTQTVPFPRKGSPLFS